MTRPGQRIRALSLRWCSDRARRRLIDPALADFQAEFASARRSGSRQRLLLTLAAGYPAIAKVLVIGGCGDLRAQLRSWQPAERAGARGGVRVGLVIVAMATAFLEVPHLANHMDLSVWPSLYLIPQALPLSVPFGLAVAAAWTLRGAARTRKLAAAVLWVAAMASAVMFANLNWLVPEANQAFRVHMVAQLDPRHDPSKPLARGFNELGWSQARQRLRQVRARADTSEIRRFETSYYRRFAISVTPVAIVVLVVALAFWRDWTRGGLIGVALGVCVANYTLMWSALSFAQFDILAPIAISWIPNLMCGLAALLLAFGGRAAAATVPPADSPR